MVTYRGSPKSCTSKETGETRPEGRGERGGETVRGERGETVHGEAASVMGKSSSLGRLREARPQEARRRAASSDGDGGAGWREGMR